MPHAKKSKKTTFSGAKTGNWQTERPHAESKKHTTPKPHASDKKIFPAKSAAKAYYTAPTPTEKPSARDSVFLWGTHAIRAAWLNPERKCYRLWMTDSAQESFKSELEEARTQGLARPNPKITTRQEMDVLVPKDAVHQGIILEAAPLPTPLIENLVESDTAPDVIVVLDQVTDPHNVGAILRSAAAFGAGGVIVTERNAPTTTGVMAKTACGAADMIPLIPVVNLARAIQTLKKAGYWCLGLAEEGKENIQDVTIKGRIAIIMGAEGEGLRRLTRENCDALVRLPTQPPLGSLNVSNAAAITLYEIKRQQKA